MAKKARFQDLILFEDEDFILIDKPPGVSTLTERQHNAKDSILAQLKDYCAEASPAHRLDKETSGVLAIAKHREAYRHLSIQFEKRETQKIYHTVVNGQHDFDDLGVFLPIFATSKGKVRIDKELGKPAQTVFKTLKAYRNHTFVACMPISGRMHQIRIHLAYLKASIVGDETYGGEQLYLSQLKRNFNIGRGKEERPIIQRVALHAKKLRFHLMDGSFQEFQADYPKDFQVLLKQLDKYGA